MWLILVSLAAGIVIGLYINLKGLVSEDSMKYNGRFQQVGIIILLFSMGATIGADSEMIGKLKSMGLKAFVFSVLTSLFAVIVTYLVTERFLKEEK